MKRTVMPDAERLQAPTDNRPKEERLLGSTPHHSRGLKLRVFLSLVLLGCLTGGGDHIKKEAGSGNVKIRPVFRFRGFKWLLKKDRFTSYRYKWDDPSGYTSSPEVVGRTIDIGAISIGVRYLKRPANSVSEHPIVKATEPNSSPAVILE